MHFLRGAFLQVCFLRGAIFAGAVLHRCVFCRCVLATCPKKASFDDIILGMSVWDFAYPINMAYKWYNLGR